MAPRCIETPLAGLVVVEPQVFTDARGIFMETYNRRDFADMGLDLVFVQDNESHSRQGTLRGLHFQRRQPQAKLVRVIAGAVFDVAVDLRPGSPTFAQWHGVRLDAETKRELFVPQGFAHGFLTLTGTAVLAYKCSHYYDPEDEAGLIWNDPDVGISWPVAGMQTLHLSDKDKRLPRLRDLGPLPPCREEAR